MAKIGNEAKLILKLALEKHTNLRDSRIQTPNSDWRDGYDKCYRDIWSILHNITAEVEYK